MNSDVDVFVDRRRNEESAVLAIIGRQISPSTAQGDSQWRTRNDHSSVRELLPKNCFHFARVAAGTFMSASTNHDTVLSELMTTDTATSPISRYLKRNAVLPWRRKNRKAKTRSGKNSAA